MERYAFSSDSPRDTTRMIPSHFAHVPLPSRPRPLRIPTPLQIPPLKNQKKKKKNVRSREFMFRYDKQKLMTAALDSLDRLKERRERKAREWAQEKRIENYPPPPPPAVVRRFIGTIHMLLQTKEVNRETILFQLVRMHGR